VRGGRGEEGMKKSFHEKESNILIIPWHQGHTTEPCDSCMQANTSQPHSLARDDVSYHGLRGGVSIGSQIRRRMWIVQPHELKNSSCGFK
jgi:hypothetical protein